MAPEASGAPGAASSLLADPTALRRALDLQQEMICEWAPDGEILYANRAHHEFFSPAAPLEGRSIDELLDRDLPPRPDGSRREGTIIRTNVLAHVALDPDRRYVAQQRYANGRTVEWTHTAMLDDDRVSSVLAIGRDVTDRLQAADDRRRDEERFRMMAVNIWDTIVLVDEHGQVIDSTARYRDDLDRPADYWSALAGLEVVHPDDQPAAGEALRALIAAGPNATASVELRVQRAGGDTTWVELTGTNLLHEPALRAVLLTVRNIEVRKQMEDELAAQLEREHAALQRQVSFVAQVSHELRNLVHGTLGLSEILAGAALPPSVGDVVTSLHRQSTTLRRIVEDLVDHAQMEAGGVHVRTEVLDLAEMFRDIVLTTEHLLPPTVRLVAPLPDPALRHVVADGDRLRQVLSNLVHNAIRHTVDGEVRVVATEGAHDGMVRIEVRDTGSGIDPAEIERLFQPYQRGAGERSHGVGLGLAIVKAAVESMGGSVGAQARRGGATFWVELPSSRANDATPIRGVRRPLPTELHAGLRALVVDDDAVNRLVATMQLETLGVEAIATDSVVTARLALEAGVYDVVLCDLHLPDGSATDLMRWLRDRGGPRPFIAVMTGDASPERRGQAVADGADHFLLKPATVADIAATLARVSPHRS